MTFTTWLAFGEITWLIGLSTWIILERRSPAATLAWVFALAWIPVLGIPVYLLIGPRRLRRKKMRYRRGRCRVAEISQSTHDRHQASDLGATDLVKSERLASLAIRAGQPPPSLARAARWFTDGDSCYEAIEQAILKAERHIHLEYYIWEPDRTGARFRDLLCEKARAGVEVRLLVDAVGAAWTRSNFFRPLREAGAEIAKFNRITLARFRPDWINFRTHRKIVVCDGRIGFTGGINICDEHSAAVAGAAAWRDTHVCIEGPPVEHLQLAFLEDWQFATGRCPRAKDYFLDSTTPATGPCVQILSSGPDQDSHAIERFFFAAITSAEDRVLVTTPYFVPNEALLSALTTAALRGVDVRILVPKRGDSWLVTAAARSYFEELARAGVRICEYGPPMLHAKTLVVDDRIALVGTANMDNRSFRLNFEIAAVFYDREIAGSLARTFERDQGRSKTWQLCEWRRAPLSQKLGESLARLLSPLL
jgi:cardiolipin synthase A/B